MSDDLIFPFSCDATLELVGGKAMNLMLLARAGLPVPQGFVVSTVAYGEFMRLNHLGELLAAAYAGLEAGRSLAEVSARIRAAFERGVFPVELARRIKDAYRQLGQDSPGVAVRSSATSEDLAEASFAGQQDSYLNLRGEDAVLDAIRRCFGSLWSERAIDYRARQGLSPLSPRLAAVVQVMVPAQAAGVSFTADPVSGDRGLMVIDAVFGLGEALVSGLATPDHLVLDKGSGRLLAYSVAEKRLRIVPAQDGTREQGLPRRMRRRRVLTKAQVQALWRLGMETEAVYGSPQDLEWCLASGKVHIVQARPITTLPAIPIAWRSPGEGQWLHGGGTFEMITEPISPLFETSLLPIFYKSIKRMLAGIGLDGVLPEEPYRVVNGFIYLHMKLRLRPWHLLGVLRDFALHLDSMKDQASEERRYRETVERLTVQPLAGLGSEEILERMRALGEAGMRYWLQIMKIVQVIYRHEKAFRDTYLRERRSTDPEPEIFLRGQRLLPWVAECSAFDLAQLARRLNIAQDLLAAGDGPVAGQDEAPAMREWREALGSHLERYGHQLSSFDLSLPTLADDPRPVISSIRDFLSGKESPYTRQERMSAQRQQAQAEQIARRTPREGARFARLLESAQKAASTRENALFAVGLPWTHLHRCALELGRRLEGSGVLAHAGDVFWLSIDEIRASLSLPTDHAAAVARRQAEGRAWSAVSAPYLLPVGSKPASWWSWIFPTPELQRHPDAHTLIGLGVSPGKVTAVARVIHSLDEMDQLSPGEILVTRTTTPAWTPLFAHISGLVTDLGGPLAHGSIVAREVGIPAVMGTGNASQKISSGQVVTILGSEGRVILS